MAAADPLETYREGMAAWSRGDLDFTLVRTTEDFEFVTAQLFPGIRPVYEGRQGLRDFWQEFIVEPWSELEIEVERGELLEDGRVLVLLGFRGIGRGSGAEVNVKYVHLATFREGLLAKIVGFRTWADAIGAVEAEAEAR